eukprot:8050297-Pyramimonas_sp.AAC.1
MFSGSSAAIPYRPYHPYFKLTVLALGSVLMCSLGEKVARGSGLGCDICLRSWGSPNPNEKKRGLVPNLPRRSERSNHCSPCVQNVYNNYPTETAKSVQQKLQSGQLDQGDYDDTLDSYEKGMRGEAQ